MLQAFKCPSCGAPLEYEGGDFQKCDFCGGNVLVPKNEMESGAGFGLDSIIGKAHKLKEIVQLARSGRKIEAIKEYRETFGCGLKEAKDAVDRLELGQSVSFQNVSFQTPVKLSPETQKKALKVAGIFGGSMLLIAIIPLIIGLVVAGFAIWKVTSTLDNVTKPANTSTIPANGSDKSAFATEIMKFGGEGIGAGQFKDNRTVAVDGNGRIYVGEFEGGKIQVFDAAGKFITQWTGETNDSIRDIAADRKGNLCVFAGSSIRCYQGETGTLISKVGGLFADGITIGLDGKIYTTDIAHGSIVVYDGALKKVAEYKDAAQKASANSGLSKIAIDGNANIYALDRQNGDICKFSPSGQFLNRFKSGDRSPDGIALDNKGRIYLSDGSGINVFNSDGQKLGSFKSAQAFGMAFNDAGELLVASRPYVVKYRIKN